MIFLAEAFTRPAADVPARQARLQPVVHLFRLAQQQGRAHRILHRADVHAASRSSSGPISGRIRPTSSPSTCSSAAARPSWCGSCSRRRSARATASTAPRSSSWSTRARDPGSEEYLDSEKYQLRHWDLARADSLRELHRAREPHPPRSSAAAERPAPEIPPGRQRSADRLQQDRRQDRSAAVLVRRQPRSASRAVRLARARSGARSGSPTRRLSRRMICSRARATSGRGRATTSRSIRATRPRTSSASATRCAASATSITLPDVKQPHPIRSARSALVQGRRHLRGARARLLRQQRRRHRRFSRAHEQARLHPGSRRQRDLAAAVLSLAAASDDGYDIADYRNIHPQYGTRADFRTFVDEAHRRGLRIITELVINHTSDQHPWFQAARRAPAGSREAKFLRLERYAGALRRHAHHLHRHRDLQLDLGQRRQGLLLAPLLQSPARSELRQPARRARREPHHALLARPGRRRAAPRCDSLSHRARRHEQRESARDARGREAHPQGHR